MTSFLIGCDPELFLKKKGKAFSAHGVIPGTKSEPYKVPGGAVQVDGMAVEFNTDPVRLDDGFQGGDYAGFEKNVTGVMKEMEKLVKQHDGDLSFNIASVQDFDEDTMKAQPKEAVELGCNPDYNAYTGKENPAPDGDAVLFRTASGHIHIGWDADIPVTNPEHVEICAGFVKYMDATVGMFMTLIETDNRRRELYGKAGAFRPKPYGVEYRTPSSVWLTSKMRRQAIFDLCRIAVTMAKGQTNTKRVTGYDEDEIRQIIDEGDYESAHTALQNMRNEYWFEFGNAYIDKEYRKRIEALKPKAEKIADNNAAQKATWASVNATYSNNAGTFYKVY